jgi:hypothetical protein
MHQDNGEQCENCRFFLKLPYHPDDTGDCVRNAPRHYKFGATSFVYPAAAQTAWCGEWQHDGVTWNDKLKKPGTSHGRTLFVDMRKCYTGDLSDEYIRECFIKQYGKLIDYDRFIEDGGEVRWFV